MLMGAQTGGAMAAPGETRPEAASVRNEFALERYRYILQQIHAVNENAHRFLALYQTLATALVTVVAAFTATLMVARALAK